MTTYKAIVEYEGTRYQGWQRQTRTGATIQGKLEDMLSRATGEEVTVDGASRTDSGVHALGQVASFRLATDIDPFELLATCYRYLPEDIVVRRLERAEPRFHARYWSLGKLYRYRVCNLRFHDVFSRRFAYHVPTPLDAGAMRKAATLLTGSHDFRAFSSVRSRKKPTTRSLTNITIRSQDDEIVLDFRADGFLTHMARILAGVLIEVGASRIDAGEIPAMLSSGVREARVPMAPAVGLILLEVFLREPTSSSEDP